MIVCFNTCMFTYINETALQNDLKICTMFQILIRLFEYTNKYLTPRTTIK